MADAPPIACGLGTHDLDGVCEPDATALLCGPGTRQRGQECIAGPDPCGMDPARVLDPSGHCVPIVPPETVTPETTSSSTADDTPALRCGPGTHAVGDGCAADPSVACGPGTHLDSALCRPDSPVTCGAGTRLSEGQCVPATVVIGSDASCRVGGAIIHLEGDPDDYIHPGSLTLRAGQWRAAVQGQHASIEVSPAAPSDGLLWSLELDASRFARPLAAGLYEDAQRYPVEAAGHPGLDLHRDGRSCTTIAGRFQVIDLATTNGVVTTLTVTFEQRCDGGPAVLRGCAHFGP